MKRLLVVLALVLTLPSAAHPQAGAFVFVWGSTITTEALGPVGGHMLIGPFRSFNGCIAFLALMHREGAGFAYVNPGQAVTQVVLPSSLTCVYV